MENINQWLSDYATFAWGLPLLILLIGGGFFLLIYSRFLPYKYLGNIMHSNRDLVKAVEYWEKYMELEPSNSSSVFDNIETALFDLGRYSEVEKFYRKVLDKNPNDVKAGQRLANVLNEKGENKAAIALIDDFIEKDTSSISVLLMKLKLSLLAKTPSELSHYVDEILERIKKQDA